MSHDHNPDHNHDHHRSRARHHLPATTTHVLGQGRLTWPSAERTTDRYGTVYLLPDGTDLSDPARSRLTVDPALAGRVGTLVAEILHTRRSGHTGDLARGLPPATPAVGERITLGHGTTFLECPQPGLQAIGLAPADGRHTDWLDPPALYRAHGQTVRLLLTTHPRH